MVKGLIIGGEFGSILVRRKNGRSLELGELLVSDIDNGKILLEVFDLLYGSQLSQQKLELVSGLKLEEDSSLEIMDSGLRAYVLARLKSLVFVSGKTAHSAKTLPDFFSNVRELEAPDVSFITTPDNPLLLGNLRSGSRVIDVPVCIDGRRALSHHVLITGTTGRGKSSMMKVLLWDSLGKGYCSMLVLDPHNEYFEKLRHHFFAREKLVYYSQNPPAGGLTLKIHLSLLFPRHFDGVVNWSDAQRQALNAYFNSFRESWIEAVLLERDIKVKFHEGTLAVVKRTLMQVLRLEVSENSISSNGVFDISAGKTTIPDIVNALENGKTVIVDTSSFHGSVEILIGSMIANMVLERHKTYSAIELRSKPVVAIVLEEAPRVIGKEVLELGPNIFSAIAREGRKFNVGLIAITQLPSLIPRDILANINTKIIFGIELRPERQAIMESAAQDLSSDDRTIASLDLGEAIVSSNFLSFAMPVKVVQKDDNSVRQRQDFGSLLK